MQREAVVAHERPGRKAGEKNKEAGSAELQLGMCA